MNVVTTFMGVGRDHPMVRVLIHSTLNYLALCELCIRDGGSQVENLLAFHLLIMNCKHTLTQINFNGNKSPCNIWVQILKLVSCIWLYLAYLVICNSSNRQNITRNHSLSSQTKSTIKILSGRQLKGIICSSNMLVETQVFTLLDIITWKINLSILLNASPHSLLTCCKPFPSLLLTYIFSVH